MIKNIAVFFICFIVFKAEAQNKPYSSSSFELIFSFAKVDSASQQFSNTVRFTCFFHLQEFMHYDVSKSIGFFSGVAIRNVGFIFDHHDVKTKMRSYSLGIPLAIKMGSLSNNFYAYAGGEIEWMFHFKRKEFENGEKSIRSEWFSSRVNPLIPSIFFGIQFPKGVNVKFKYYLENFLNPSFTETVNGTIVQPYKGWSTQMFYVSLALNIRNKNLRPKKSKAKEVMTMFY